MCMIPVHFTTVLRVNLHHLILVLFLLFFCFSRRAVPSLSPRESPSLLFQLLFLQDIPLRQTVAHNVTNALRIFSGKVVGVGDGLFWGGRTVATVAVVSLCQFNQNLHRWNGNKFQRRTGPTLPLAVTNNFRNTTCAVLGGRTGLGWWGEEEYYGDGIIVRCWQLSTSPWI